MFENLMWKGNLWMYENLVLKGNLWIPWKFDVRGTLANVWKGYLMKRVSYECLKIWCERVTYNVWKFDVKG